MSRTASSNGRNVDIDGGTAPYIGGDGAGAGRGHISTASMRGNGRQGDEMEIYVFGNDKTFVGTFVHQGRGGAGEGSAVIVRFGRATRYNGCAGRVCTIFRADVEHRGNCKRIAKVNVAGKK